MTASTENANNSLATLPTTNTNSSENNDHNVQQDISSSAWTIAANQDPLDLDDCLENTFGENMETTVKSTTNHREGIQIMKRMRIPIMKIITIMKRQPMMMMIIWPPGLLLLWHFETIIPEMIAVVARRYRGVGPRF